MKLNCPNCGGTFDERLAQLLIDTGVRGVVCGNCNTAFAPLGNDPSSVVPRPDAENQAGPDKEPRLPSDSGSIEPEESRATEPAAPIPSDTTAPDSVRLIFTRACQRLVGDSAATKFADHYGRTLPRLSVPGSTDTCAVALSLPKTAALCFDKIWTTGDAPDEIRAFGGSPAEVAILVIPSVAARILQSIESDSTFDKKVWRKVVQNLQSQLVAEIVYSRSEATQLQLAAMTNFELAAELTVSMCSRTAVRCFSSKGIKALPLYDSVAARHKAYEEGQTSVVVAVLDALDVVDEAQAEWSQILEFRRDDEAKRKYRRFIRWLDVQMVGKTERQIAETIEERLDDYRWALRKHGLKTVSGLIESSISESSIVAAAATAVGAAYASGSLLAALLGLTIPGLKMTAECIKLRIAREEVQRGPGSEVAFVHEVDKRLRSG